MGMALLRHSEYIAVSMYFVAELSVRDFDVFCRQFLTSIYSWPRVLLSSCRRSLQTTTTPWRRRGRLVSGDRKQSDVTWRTVTSSTRRRERTWASVENEQDKMADWVVSTSHSQTCCTSYSHISMPHQLNTSSSSSNTTSSFTSKVNSVIRWRHWICFRSTRLFYTRFVLFFSFYPVIIFSFPPPLCF